MLKEMILFGDYIYLYKVIKWSLWIGRNSGFGTRKFCTFSIPVPVKYHCHLTDISNEKFEKPKFPSLNTFNNFSGLFTKLVDNILMFVEEGKDDRLG